MTSPLRSAAVLLTLVLGSGCDPEPLLVPGGSGDVATGGGKDPGGHRHGPGRHDGEGRGGASHTKGSGHGSANGGAGGGGGCTPACAAREYCEASTSSCICSPGFVREGGVCTTVAPGDPTTHDAAEVCSRWADGHTIEEPDPTKTTGEACDAGMLRTGAILDTLVRINLFRWMVGLGPVSDDATLNAGAQKCANLEAWWNFGSGSSPHAPPSDAACYTSEGASTAGASNIAWGSGHPSYAIDIFMQDFGNATTMGHRRWLMYPPLDPVGIGYWQGGGSYGDAECLHVFSSSGTGPTPAWVAMPPPGFVPMDVAGWTWTFHGNVGGVGASEISMVRVSDNTQLPVTIQRLAYNFGQEAVSWTPSGWNPVAGETYRVTVAGLTGGDVVYDVKPIACP